jgi:membrane protein DedA with SNARE-associated domain
VRPATRFTLVLILALCIPLVPFLAIGELPGERWLSATDDNALRFGAFGAGLLAGDVLMPIPSSIVGTLLGARLGFLPGLLWCWAGLMLGNLIGYGGGRLLLSRLAPPAAETPTLLVLFASRPVPVLAEALTFTAGAQGLPIMPFLLTSAAGNLLYALVLSGNGAALIPDAALGPGLIVPMATPVAAWLIWRSLARSGGKPHLESTD